MALEHVDLTIAEIQTDDLLDNLPPYRDGKFESKPKSRVTLREGIDEFLADSESCLLAFESALHDHNIDIFKREAHTIKSASANIGVGGLLEIASRLEEIGTIGEIGPAVELLASLKSEFEQVRNYFRGYLNSRISSPTEQL